MRGREFIMKDAYVDGEDLTLPLAMEEAYRRVFTVAGYRSPRRGRHGSESHEFMVLASTGEATAPAAADGANAEKQ